MTIAKDIIYGRAPDFAGYVQAGNSLDDIDEYGFTLLIESVLAKRIEITDALIRLGADVNKQDSAGRTPLQWAVDNQDITMVKKLLSVGADPNSFTKQGFSALVYPLLRNDVELKTLLLQSGANLNFAQDFILAKLLGHRFSLKGTVDIVTPKNEMIEVFYEGFVLEFTVATLANSLGRFIKHYSARRWVDEFAIAEQTLHALKIADKLLTFQRFVHGNRRFHAELTELVQEPLLILPVASAGHAMGFIRYKNWLAKIDRGENSIKEGSVNIYEISKPQLINAEFIDNFIFRRQTREFFHEKINVILGLKKIATLPMSAQVTGNCSWANMEACIAVCHWIQSVYPNANLELKDIGSFYLGWLRWDQDRGIEELIASLQMVNKVRKASIISILCAVLFQNLDSKRIIDMSRAEKILSIVVDPDYKYILQSYIEVYCDLNRNTVHGNNLLQIMDNCGYDPGQLGLTFAPRK